MRIPETVKMRLLPLLLLVTVCSSAALFTSCRMEPVSEPVCTEDTPELPEEILRSFLNFQPEPATSLPETESLLKTEPETQDETVPEETEPETEEEEEPDPNLQAEFYKNGLFLYGDAVYSQPFFHAGNAEAYMNAVKYYKDLFGENTRVSTVISPISSMVIRSEQVQSMIPDNKVILNQMKALSDPSVNFVDVYSALYEHRKEYLFFKTDHHWTARGAYYAYCAFARSVGLEPAPLDAFDCTVCNNDYHGSMYAFTGDERVLALSDVIEVFRPRKALTMTVTYSSGVSASFDSLFADNATYTTFLSGDNPYTVINIPDNPQDMRILVLKDSFGNAFVPFLCEHYGTIYVVDVRYSDFNIYDLLGSCALTDIVFVNNLEQANTFSWSRDYMAAVGVTLD